MRRLVGARVERRFPHRGRQLRFDPVQSVLEENGIEASQVDMERHGAIGRFRMCAGSMLRRHAAKRGFVVIGGKKITAPGTKKRGRKAKTSAEAS